MILFVQSLSESSSILQPKPSLLLLSESSSTSISELSKSSVTTPSESSSLSELVGTGSGSTFEDFRLAPLLLSIDFQF